MGAIKTELRRTTTSDTLECGRFSGLKEVLALTPVSFYTLLAHVQIRSCLTTMPADNNKRRPSKEEERGFFKKPPRAV